MKKVTSLLLLVGVAAFGLVACGDNVVPPDGGNVEGITVTPSVLNIAVGGSGALSADVDGDPDNSVTWSSNNAAVATVDGDGNVTGVSEGNAVVKATSTVDDAHSASAEINVTATEKAEVSIASITDAGGAPIDVDDVSGQINITLNVSEGDQSIETVDLLIDGEVASSQDFVSANIVEGAEAQGEVSQITFNFRTDRAPADAAMDGTPVEGEFQNGERVVSAQLTLSSGGTNTATNSQTLNFNNQDRVVVTRLSGGQGVVGNGVRYWGGEDMTFAATAVLFSGRGVGSITLNSAAGAATANGGAAMAFDAATATSSPFQFEVVAADQGTVEDDPSGVGHSITVASMQDADGVNYTLGSDIMAENMSEFFVDYVGPAVNTDGNSEITVDGSAIAGAEWFSGGDFGLANVDELGVGGTNLSFDVQDAEEADPFEDIVGIGDLDERENDKYTTIATGVADNLGNETDISSGSGNEVAGGDNTSPAYGVDRTPLGITDVLPSGDLFLNPDDDAGDGTGDNDLTFTAEDPVLADGTAGSGYNTSTTAAEHSDGTTATPALIPAGGQGGGVATLVETGALQDGAWTVVVTSTDNATVPNEVETAYGFSIDQTDPTTNMSNPPSANVTSSNSTLTFTISGSASDDGAGLESVTVTVRDANGETTPDGACELTDAPLPVGSAAGEVDQNEVDVTADASDFSVDFTITNNETDATDENGENQDLCFFIESLDAAQDVNGDNEGNASSQNANTVIDWQP